MAVVSKEFPEQAVLVLTPTNELLTADVIQEIKVSFDSTAAKHVILDLGSVKSLVSGSLYLNAEPIMPLMRLHMQLLAEARRLVFCNLSSDIAEVFRVTRLDRFFEVQRDLRTALSHAVGENVE